MASDIVFDRALTKPDVIVLQRLQADIAAHASHHGTEKTASSTDSSLGDHHDEPHQTRAGLQATSKSSDSAQDGSRQRESSTTFTGLDAEDAASYIEALNNPEDAHFEPTIICGVDLSDFKVPLSVEKYILQPYIRFARTVVRVETDVVMLTHMFLYFFTSVPSAILLFRHFTYIHGLLHFVMQMSYIGTYTLMMHQHIHMRGILHRRFAWFDQLFPYITDPLMGHTWNSYFYHHVKHHHIEGNGPDDLSSTLRYQRDDIFNFLHYVGRFYFFIWLELPLYFLRKGRYTMAIKAGFWELSWYATLIALYRYKPQPMIFVFLLPLLCLRAGLMVGNWGQHAFVDHDEPDSDYRSSITLIDVPSNRFCYNDGYHTSHHLNPRRHWRDHPAAFLRGKGLYASQHALVFHNIDYIMITVRLMLKDYDNLAQNLVPMGDQIAMTMEERKQMLRRATRRFSEEEIRQKFK